MKMEKWFENLSKKERSKISDIADNYMLGFVAESREDFLKKQEVELNKAKEQMYKKHLKEVKEKQEKIHREKELEEQSEKEYKQDLAKGIATIELYESNKYRCWVAEVKGIDSTYEFDRNFINPTKIQGNYKTYSLKEGSLYNYMSDNRQHFAKVVNSKLTEMSAEEMKELVK